MLLVNYFDTVSWVTGRIPGMAAWCSGNVHWCIGEVAHHWAWLVLGWVTIFGPIPSRYLHQVIEANSASYP